MEKRSVLRYSLVVMIGIVLVSILFILQTGPTGFAVFEDNEQNEFDLGVYNNTQWNGSAVVLAGENLSGDYVSQIFDAGNDAIWNNLSAASESPAINYLYGVDGGGDIYMSTDAVLWILSAEDYGRTSDSQEMFSGDDYMYIISNSNKEVWRSSDGISWVVVASDFADSGLLMGESYGSNLYIVDASGDVYVSIDQGMNWEKKGDFNGAGTNNARGFGIDSSGNLYVVDGSRKVFTSSDAVTWIQQTSDHGAGGTSLDDLEVDSSGNLYMLDNKDIWKSVDQGQNWMKINDSITPYSNDGLRMLIDSEDNFYVADGSGRILMSIDSGISWREQGDLNSGAGSDPKGLTDFSKTSEISFHVKNCSLSDCSDGTWQTTDLEDIGLVSQYFQYKVSFITPDSSVSPSLEIVGLDYTLVNSAPIITIDSLQEGATYGYNESLALNYIVFDNDDNLDSCWYNINQGENITLANCANITFDVTGNGNYELIIYANDALGLESSDEVSFSVEVGAPTIVLNYPINVYLNHGEGIEFNYTPSDIDLESCELWGNFNAGFELNQSDGSVTSGEINSFELDLDDGEYLWNIQCNDSVGNSAFNGNKTFYVDMTNPDVNISEPSGEKNSREEISLDFSVADSSPINCRYNITSSIGTEIVSGVGVDDCAATNFDMASDGDYILYLIAEDAAGNLEIVNSSFSIDSSLVVIVPPSSGGSSSGGGGGGGGSITPINQSGKIESSVIGSLILREGDKKTLSLDVENSGRVFLNKCKLIVSGDLESWIYSDQIEGIAPGENVNFVFDMNVPEGIDAGDYSGRLEINCEEGLYSQDLNVKIPEELQTINILSVTHTEKGLALAYSFDNSNVIGEEVTIEMWLQDEIGDEVGRITDIFPINKDGLIERNINLELPEDLVGIYYIHFAISPDLDDFVRQSVVLGESAATGNVVFGTTRGRIISYLVFVVFIGAGVLLVLKGHKKHHKREKKRNKWLLRKRHA